MQAATALVERLSLEVGGTLRRFKRSSQLASLAETSPTPPGETEAADAAGTKAIVKEDAATSVTDRAPKDDNEDGMTMTTDADDPTKRTPPLFSGTDRARSEVSVVSEEASSEDETASGNDDARKSASDASSLPSTSSLDQGVVAPSMGGEEGFATSSPRVGGGGVRRSESSRKRRRKTRATRFDDDDDDDEDWSQFWSSEEDNEEEEEHDAGGMTTSTLGPRSWIRAALKRRPDGTLKVSRPAQTVIELSQTPMLLLSAWYLVSFSRAACLLHVFWAVAHGAHAFCVEFLKPRPSSFSWLASYAAHRRLDYAFFVSVAGAPLLFPARHGPLAPVFVLVYGLGFLPALTLLFDPTSPDLSLDYDPRFRDEKKRKDPRASAVTASAFATTTTTTTTTTGRVPPSVVEKKKKCE